MRSDKRLGNSSADRGGSLIETCLVISFCCVAVILGVREVPNSIGEKFCALGTALEGSTPIELLTMNGASGPGGLGPLRAFGGVGTESTIRPGGSFVGTEENNFND